MKKLNNMTSYELFMYGGFTGWDVEYIQFDANMRYHNVGEIQRFGDLYNEWSNNGRNNELFSALIKWFDIEPDRHLIRICLLGRDGILHYEN